MTPAKWCDIGAQIGVPNLAPLFKVDSATLRLERVDGDKVRIVYAGWDDAKVLLAGECGKKEALFFQHRATVRFERVGEIRPPLGERQNPHPPLGTRCQPPPGKKGPSFFSIDSAAVLFARADGG
jgi:hypothetical protein